MSISLVIVAIFFKKIVMAGEKKKIQGDEQKTKNFEVPDRTIFTFDIMNWCFKSNFDILTFFHSQF